MTTVPSTGPCPTVFLLPSLLRLKLVVALACCWPSDASPSLLVPPALLSPPSTPHNECAICLEVLASDLFQGFPSSLPPLVAPAPTQNHKSEARGIFTSLLLITKFCFFFLKLSPILLTLPMGPELFEFQIIEKQLYLFTLLV